MAGMLNSFFLEYYSHFQTNSNTSSQQLLDIWQSLLGKKDISNSSNFFDLGGDSLKLITLYNKIKNINNKILIEIIDNGIGMSKAVQSKIFDKFFN